MRIRAITPIVVSDDELARRQARYTALAPPPLQVALVSLPDGPERLESSDDIRESEERVFQEAIRTNPSAFDAILPDCVLDTALDRLTDLASLPVYGITRLSATFLCSLGHRIAAVTRNKVIAEELRNRLESYGLGTQLSDIKVLNLDVEDIALADKWNSALALALADVGPADTVINGCSAVEVGLVSEARVIDPTSLALDLIAAAWRSGLVGQGNL